MQGGDYGLLLRIRGSDKGAIAQLNKTKKSNDASKRSYSLTPICDVSNGVMV